MTATPESLTLTPLLADTARGDEAAFQKLYVLTSNRLMGLCVQLLNDRHLAEDVLQDTYIRIWHHAGEYHEERGKPLTWMMTLARYLCLDVLRARKHRAGTPMHDEEDTAGPETINARADLLNLLGECLGQLSAEQRDSVLHIYYRGFTHGELALRMDKPLGTVKSWTRRGVQYLRRCLEP